MQDIKINKNNWEKPNEYKCVQHVPQDKSEISNQHREDNIPLGTHNPY